MAHRIVFDDEYNSWNNALPLGNGKMGAMVFFEDHVLHIALNHYDCYYDALSRYSGKKKEASKPAKLYKDLCGLVDNAREDKDYQTMPYTGTFNPAAMNRRPEWSLASYPMAGEILIALNRDLDEFSLQLVIEEGLVLLNAKYKDKEAGAKIWIAKTADGLFAELHESEPGLWAKAEITKPGRIGQERYSTEQGFTENTCWLRTSFGDKVAETVLSFSNDGIAASVFPCFDAAAKQNEYLLQNKEKLKAEHEDDWKGFWRATIHIPDYFLETLWYLHLYVLGCASGKGGRYFEQACGLNGLWDIRRPNLWASTWYWDVNIQEAFWPVFSSNQLEMAKLFCDAYLSYAQNIENFTQAHHGYAGWALDYPHLFYNCIQPWCAQFLWRYYSYSGDLDFLREKAYPVFEKQIAFFKNIAVPDNSRKLHINYDISPEQGPVTKDSVATIASIKQLLVYAVQSAEILGRPSCEKEEFGQLLAALPEYERSSDKNRWKDSAMAKDDLFLRHPSVLMPVFPADEVSKNSPEEIRNLALNTVKYASQNTEIGVFGFGWLACAAAKMGEGAAALRILYEKGLDYVIHPNGLGYEESERYINHCLITKPPLYPPAMMEPSGGIVMAVNTMLLSSHDFIEVFPAIPGTNDRLAEAKAQYVNHDSYLRGNYPAWENCRFDGMLAEGGFEISAEKSGGKIIWIKVHSRRKGNLRLMLPAQLSPSCCQTVFEKEMMPGEDVFFGSTGTHTEQERPQVQVRETAVTHRRISLGENRHTKFYKAVDSFVCAYLLGNDHRYQMLPYVFDFGISGTDKNYDDAYHRAFCMSGRSAVFFGMPKRLGMETYNENTGYGFASAQNLNVRDRQAPDDLRRDFIEGTCNSEFIIELPKGKYNALVVSGDECEESLTHILLPHMNATVFGEMMKPGKYQCRTVPFVHECDGLFKIGISTAEGYKWKLNAIFIGKEFCS